MTNWSAFPMYDVCFPSAGHRPVKVFIPAKMFNSLAIVFPSVDEDELEVVVGLLEKDMDKFSLDF